MTAGMDVFGVRHLSPGGMWRLRAMLDSIKPKVVLIEEFPGMGWLKDRW